MLKLLSVHLSEGKCTTFVHILTKTKEIMNKITGNEPIHPDKDFGNVGAVGLTKREYFAGLAMQGLLAGRSGGWLYEVTANDAVKYADALINKLNKNG